MNKRSKNNSELQHYENLYFSVMAVFAHGSRALSVQSHKAGRSKGADGRADEGRHLNLRENLSSTDWDGFIRGVKEDQI